MTGALRGAVLVVFVIAAILGVRRSVEFIHESDFRRARTIAKVTRFGKNRQTRLDLWFGQQHRAPTLEWSQASRDWFEDAVPVRLVVVAGSVREEYLFQVDLEQRMMRPVNRQTRRLVERVRRWAIGVDRAGGVIP